MTQKVAIYIRVSTHWQVDKDSLQVQRRELLAYADIVLGITDTEIFEDPGYSAKNTDRPAYQSMMARLRTGEFSHLLVWKIDRISRNLLDFTTMYKELKSLGVTFVSKNEKFDTSSAIGEAMLKIILVFAELERQMTAERVTAVMLSRANNSQWNGGRIPYGYTYNPSTKEFAIDEYESSVYRMIVKQYEEGASLLDVANTLNAASIRTKIGRDWSSVSVHKILTNPFYRGAYRYNVHSDGKAIQKRDENEWVIIENHHPRMIDDERFERLQIMLHKNRRNFPGCKNPHREKHVHIFAGILKCGVCGSAMTASKDSIRADGWTPTQYGCSRRRKAKECDNRFANDTYLVPFVFTFVANIFKAREKKPKTVQQLTKILLKGDSLADVESIECNDFEAFLTLLTNSTDGEYQPMFSDAKSNEYTLVSDKKRKAETALNRLKTLYLYSESGMSEKDYIIEQNSILDIIKSCDETLSKIASTDTDQTVAEKESYLLMVDNLLNWKDTSFEKVIRKIDMHIPESFIHTILSSMTVTYGKVTSITFPNDIKFDFKYKENRTQEQASETDDQ